MRKLFVINGVVVLVIFVGAVFLCSSGVLGKECESGWALVVRSALISFVLDVWMLMSFALLFLGACARCP